METIVWGEGGASGQVCLASIMDHLQRRYVGFGVSKDSKILGTVLFYLVFFFLCVIGWREIPVCFQKFHIQ